MPYLVKTSGGLWRRGLSNVPDSRDADRHASSAEAEARADASAGDSVVFEPMRLGTDRPCSRKSCVCL